MLCEADRVVDSARSGRSFFPRLSRESGELPTPAWQSRGTAGAVRRGWAGSPWADSSHRSAGSPAARAAALGPGALPQPLTHATPQLAGLLCNVTFSRLCVTLLQLRNWLRFFFLVQFRVCWGFFLIAKAVGNGQNRKSLSVSSNSPLWLPSSVWHFFTPATCDSAQHLVLPHQSFLFTPNTTFPLSCPPSSKFGSSGAEQPGGGSTPSPGGAGGRPLPGVARER